MLFRLIGCTKVFRVVKAYKAAGFIPSYKGISLDGAWETCARVEDVVPVPDVFLAPAS